MLSCGLLRFSRLKGRNQLGSKKGTRLSRPRDAVERLLVVGGHQRGQHRFRRRGIKRGVYPIPRVGRLMDIGMVFASAVVGFLSFMTFLEQSRK